MAVDGGRWKVDTFEPTEFEDQREESQ